LKSRDAMLEKDYSSEAAAAEELAQCVSPATVIRCHEPLAKHTTMRVGGPADLYVEPATDEDLAAVLAFCNERSRPSFVLGRGSNLLAKDGGFRGAVICLSHTHFSRVGVAGERLNCGAGARLKAVAAEARRNGLTGLEFLEGIPGSVGGALRMNAGAMGSALFDVVESVRLMSCDGQVREQEARTLLAAYRSCPALRTQIALSAVMRGHLGLREAIEQRMNEYSRKRWQSQPAAPSAGCIFKNPGSIPAGRLIDELGLKGTRVGGAVVSAEHGNFIVNDGGATTRDILELIEIIRQRARAERGIELETEVEVVGE
jgi:UDP-N-acetylenolpyruvoylglucosamine reductase